MEGVASRTVRLADKKRLERALHHPGSHAAHQLQQSWWQFAGKVINAKESTKETSWSEIVSEISRVPEE